MYHDIHDRRKELVYSKYTFDNLDFEPIRGKEDIGRFEFRYNYPTDIDKVWEERDKIQDQLTKAMGIPSKIMGKQI